MPLPKKSRITLLLSLFLATGTPGLFAADAPPVSPLAGHWKIDLARSTELSPWKDYDLTIALEGDAIVFRRSLAWGIRAFADGMTVHAGRTDTVPVEMWPDNRHLGAYISDDHQQRVHAEWLDDRRLLRLSTDLTLETQQGARAVNILSDYKVNVSGSQLTLTELRSTRNRPIVYVFNRVPAKS